MQSVGKGGVNDVADVKVVQRRLNNYLLSVILTPDTLKVDGYYGPATARAIRTLQSTQMVEVSELLKPDDSCSLLLAESYSQYVSHPNLPKPVLNINRLSDLDYNDASKILKCEEATIRAVVEVESNGGGFLASHRPKILFEAHQFSKLTDHQYDTRYPNISSLKWNKSLYYGGEEEYNRLFIAMSLNSDAALKAASWGLFQIMGFNCLLCGYSSVANMVTAMYISEGYQLRAFILFLKSTKLDQYLINKDFSRFAAGYNGPGYKNNNYDDRLWAAYDRYA